MCLILAAWKTHPYFPLIMVANRDEFYQRPTQVPHYWVKFNHVYAGKDLQGDGTWLGVNRFNKLAAITNYRDPSRFKPSAHSRGLITADFLKNDVSIDQHLSHLQKHHESYNDFNLFLFDGESFTCFESKLNRATYLNPGVYGLSNHFLDTPWPKLVSTKKRFHQVISQEIVNYSNLDLFNDHALILNQIAQILHDETIYSDDLLPSTGVPLEIERRISAAFIKSDDYGTRATTVVIANQTGDFLFYEKQYGTNGIFEGETCRIVHKKL